MRSSGRFAVVIAALVGAVSAATPVMADGASPDAAAEETSFDLVNDAREQEAMAALRWDEALAAVARAHSRDMAEDTEIYHNDDLPDDVDRDWKALGENVGRASSAESVHSGFMGSAGHRANILGDYTLIGTGAYRNGAHVYVTQVFMTPDEASTQTDSSSVASSGGSTHKTSTSPARTTRTPSPAPARYRAAAVAPMRPAPLPAAARAPSEPGPARTLDALESLNDLYG